MSKILPNAFFHNMITKAHKYLTLSTFLFCFVRSLRFLFQNYTFLKLNKIYFLLIFDHQITKAHKYLTLLYYFFCQITEMNFSSFFSIFYLSKFHFFKIFQNFTLFFLFWKLDNWKCSHLLAHWLFKKKFHYRRSAKRGLTKKENTRENAF